MGRAFQVINGYVTAPSTTFTALTLASGDSLTVKNGADGSAIYLLNFWGVNQTAGRIRVRSNLLHDGVVGMEAYNRADQARPLMAMHSMQMLKPQDTLEVHQTGSATAGDIEMTTLMLYYADLPGAAANLATWDQIRNRIESYMYVENTLSTGTSGGYSGEEAINAEDDQFKANRDYALLGALVSAQCGCVGWRGPDTSNLRVGLPGAAAATELTQGWFVNLSIATGLPTIPIINAANKAATLIDCTQDEDGADPIVTSIFGLLK